MIPQKLICSTDDNELEFVKIIKGKEIILEYRFSKSQTKKGMIMTFSEDQLKKSLSNKIFSEQHED